MTPRPSSLPIAYGTFFGAQVVICMILLFQSYSITSFLLAGYTETVSLAILLLMARNLSLETQLGVRLVFVFFIHNLISLALTLRRLIYSGVDGDFSKSSDLFDVSMGALYLFWAISGAIAIVAIKRHRLGDFT